MEVPREVMMDFFTGCIAMLMDDDNVEEMLAEAASTGKGLQLVCAEFQRDVMERNYQIEKNFGCRYMSSLPQQYPDDQELLKAGVDFTKACQDAYIYALKYRANKLGNVRRTTGGMSRTIILEFFEGCNARSTFYLLYFLSWILSHCYCIL